MKRPAFVIGIDPGFSGAIAVINLTGIGEPVAVHDMPTLPNAKGKTELNHRELFLRMAAYSHNGPTEVWLEKVGARPGQGVSSMFRFGQQLGAIEMAAAAHGHVLRYVTPATWKAHFGLSADKGVSRGYASNRLPDLAHLFARAKDDGRAEAALIALYGVDKIK